MYILIWLTTTKKAYNKLPVIVWSFSKRVFHQIVNGVSILEKKILYIFFSFLLSVIAGRPEVPKGKCR